MAAAAREAVARVVVERVAVMVVVERAAADAKVAVARARAAAAAAATVEEAPEVMPSLRAARAAASEGRRHRQFCSRLSQFSSVEAIQVCRT
jgi:hypothetical protein